MKNKNILLDTNAFIYLMRNEKECSNTISLENRQINESKFYDECKNANYLFITSQTLYEIFWQSIKKTKKIDQFAYYYDQIIKFNKSIFSLSHIASFIYYHPFYLYLNTSYYLQSLLSILQLYLFQIHLHYIKFSLI